MKSFFNNILIGIILIPVVLFGEKKNITQIVKPALQQTNILESNGSKTKSDIPTEIDYQGWLGTATDTVGRSETLNMIFRLYSVPAGGTTLWSETRDSIQVSKGIFNVLLGSITPIPDSLFNNISLYLETQVGTEVLSPRKKLVSVAYAFKSKKADTATYATQAKSDNDWTISGSNMYSVAPGNVGIGTTNPDEKLDVTGDINVSSTYKISGQTVLSLLVGNIFLGASTGNSSITGTNNTFLGCWAGHFGTTGYYNTFSGYSAGRANKTGNNNVFTGCYAGDNNNGGNYNTFSGSFVGYSNTGNYNTFSGYRTGFYNTGDNNTFFGSNAGFSNHEGRDNTFFGNEAGFYNDTGNGNVFIGNKAGYGEGCSGKLYVANNSNNTLIYGDFTNKQIGIGTTITTHTIDVTGGAYCTGTNWINASSREYKENIKELNTEEAVKTINGLNPVTFNYKTDKTQNYCGFIAEDVPEMVAMKDKKGLSPMDIVAVLTKVVQQQQSRIDLLEKKIKELENKRE